MKDIQLTKEGLGNLKKEYHQLKEVKRPEAVERLQKARGMGDLSENSEYTAARDGLNLIDERIAEIDEILKRAQVVEDNHSNKEVSLGSTVLLQFNGSENNYQIVGEFEANPMQKKLSVTSPLGKALLGKTIGNTVEVEVPAGKVVYEILEIK